MKRFRLLNPRKFLLPTLLFASVLLLGLQSCKKDKAPLSNLTGITSFSIQGFEDVTFTIDQQSLVIQNADSLPFQTNASAMVAIFNTIEGTKVTVNGVEQQSGVTPNNFSNEVNYVTTAEDGVTTRTYKVKVNIAKVDPNTVAWQRVSDNPGWGPYRTTAAGAFSNNLYVFGAQSGSFGVFNSGTFRSTDGATWTTLTTDLSPLPFSERSTAVFGFQNKIWLLGGLVPQIELNFSYVSNQTWSSSNGTSWTATDRIVTPEPGQMWDGRERIPALVYQDKLWVIGGNGYPSFGNADSPGTPMNDVWSTTNGTTWTEVLPKLADVTGNPNRFAPRTNPAVCVHDNKMYLIGGRNASGTLLNDVWTSTDGSTWTKLTVTGEFPPVWGHQVVSYNGQLFLLGGFVKNEANADVINNDMWVSENNGVTWTKVAAGDPRALPGTYQGRAFFSFFVQNNTLWIVGGESRNAENARVYRNDVWKGVFVKQ